MTDTAAPSVPFFAKKRNVVLIALFYTFLWGSAFPLVKRNMELFSIAGGDEASKCLVAGLRFVISGLLLLLFRLIRRQERTPVSKKAILCIPLYGILSTAVQYAFTYIGLSNLDGSKGAVYDQFAVFLTVIAGGLFLADDHLTVKKGIGCILGFLGIFTVSLEELSSAFSFSFTLSGEGMMLLASVCQTGSYLLAKQCVSDIAPELLVGLGQLLGGGVLTAGALLAGGHIGEFSPAGLLILLALACISAAAYVLSLQPLKYFPASETAAFNLLIPVFGTLLSALVLKERISLPKYGTALLLIGLGIYFINRRSGKIQNSSR